MQQSPQDTLERGDDRLSAHLGDLLPGFQMCADLGARDQDTGGRRAQYPARIPFRLPGVRSRRTGPVDPPQGMPALGLDDGIDVFPRREPRPQTNAQPGR